MRKRDRRSTRVLAEYRSQQSGKTKLIKLYNAGVCPYGKKKSVFIEALRGGTFFSFVKIDTYFHVRARFFYEAKNFPRATETPREVASRTQDPETLILEPGQRE